VQGGIRYGGFADVIQGFFNNDDEAGEAERRLYRYIEVAMTYIPRAGGDVVLFLETRCWVFLGFTNCRGC
jgi:hypothetical protein